MKIQKDKLVQLRATHGIFPRINERLFEGMFLQDKPDSLGFIEFQEYKKVGLNKEYEESAREPIFINLNKVGSVMILDKEVKKD